MKKKKEKRRCYACRKPITGEKLFCKECDKDPKSRKHTASTLIIYTTV